jgi:hypothetical protein
MGEAAYYAEIFEREIRKLSVDKKDFIQEWELAKQCIGAKSQCICTHPINQNYYIINKLTGARCIIGSDCVQRWMNPKLMCEGCGGALGCVMERIRKQDFHCRSCKGEKRRARESTIRRFSSWKLDFPGPWKGLTFEKVCENQEWAEKLINTEWQGTGPLSYIYKSLKAFQLYANAVFVIEESQTQIE